MNTPQITFVVLPISSHYDKSILVLVAQCPFRDGEHDSLEIFSDTANDTASFRCSGCDMHGSARPASNGMYELTADLA